MGRQGTMRMYGLLFFQKICLTYEIKIAWYILIDLI